MKLNETPNILLVDQSHFARAQHMIFMFPFEKKNQGVTLNFWTISFQSVRQFVLRDSRRNVKKLRFCKSSGKFSRFLLQLRLIFFPFILDSSKSLFRILNKSWTLVLAVVLWRLKSFDCFRLSMYWILYYGVFREFILLGCKKSYYFLKRFFMLYIRHGH